MIERTAIAACLLGLAAIVAVGWVAARVLAVCDDEIQSDFSLKEEK